MQNNQNNFKDFFNFGISKLPETLTVSKIADVIESEKATAAEIANSIDSQLCRGEARFLFPDFNLQRPISTLNVTEAYDLLQEIWYDALGGPLQCFTYQIQLVGMPTTLYLNERIYMSSVINKLVNYKPENYFETFFYDEPTAFYNILVLMNESIFFENYSKIFIFLIIATIIAFIIIIASYSLSIQKPDTEKTSAYECGFEPYEDARHRFDIKFCLIAILFIVFDIEVVYLIPWSVELSKLDILGFWAMVEFLFELGLGFVYIWLSKSLEWDLKA